MNETNRSAVPEPRKVGVWTDTARIEPKELIIPMKQSTASSDDIPTLPDIDDFQDILEKDLSNLNVSEPYIKDSETANTLAEVGGRLSGTEDGMEAVIETLRSYVPKVELDTTDTIWTIDSLLAQLADEEATGGT